MYILLLIITTISLSLYIYIYVLYYTMIYYYILCYTTILHYDTILHYTIPGPRRWLSASASFSDMALASDRYLNRLQPGRFDSCRFLLRAIFQN